MTKLQCIGFAAPILRESRRAAEAGFTLIEMLVVITIIGLIMALVAPRVLNYLGESKVKAARIQIASLGSALDLFYLDEGRYPTTGEGLAALVERHWQRDGLEWTLSERQLSFPPILGDTPTSIVRQGNMGRMTSPPMAPMAKKVEREPQVTLRAGHVDDGAQAGFTLLEIVCVLAIIATARGHRCSRYPAWHFIAADRGLRAADGGACSTPIMTRRNDNTGKSQQ